MGTNYYVVPNRPSIAEPIHIGKSSAGWMFHFQEQHEEWNEPAFVWSTFDEVKDWLKKNTVDSDKFVIINEYDKVISYDDFVKLVETKQCEDCNNKENFSYGVKNVNGYRFSSGDFL